jgi:metal-responsive CopG/Arc/MetJ family transcriptional regulator
METISLKLEEGILKEIDEKLAKHRYSTRTEFIRDAIREKLSEFEKEEMLKAVAKLRGISKRKTTDEQLHKAGEKAFELLEKKFKSR